MCLVVDRVSPLLMDKELRLGYQVEMEDDRLRTLSCFHDPCRSLQLGSCDASYGVGLKGGREKNQITRCQ